MGINAHDKGAEAGGMPASAPFIVAAPITGEEIKRKYFYLVFNIENNFLYAILVIREINLDRITLYGKGEAT